MSESTVYRTWDEPMAKMAVGLLAGAGINARILSDMTRSVYPFTMDGLGELRIVVPEEEEERAIELLSVRFSDEGLTDEYGEDGLSEDESPEEGEDSEEEGEK